MPDLTLCLSGFDFQQSVQYETAEIPCRPTHPDVSVSLSLHGRGPVTIDNKYITYSPKVTAIINNISPPPKLCNFLSRPRPAPIIVIITRSKNRPSLLPGPGRLMGGLQWGDTVTCEAQSVTQNDTKQTKPHHTLHSQLSIMH